MTKNCNNCWWFCHSTGQCFRNADMTAVDVPTEKVCKEWAFDCLEDWEREPEVTLVTMEEK